MQEIWKDIDKIDERFWSKVDIRNREDCWEYQAGISSSGYGGFDLYGEKIGSHCVAYMLSKGPIPEKDINGNKIYVIHLCNNKKCCNPNHLELGNNSENMKYAVSCGIFGNNGKGENNGMSVLTDDKVREIHKLYKQNWTIGLSRDKNFHIRESIAKKFGITKQHVDRIIGGRSWYHIYKEFY